MRTMLRGPPRAGWWTAPARDASRAVLILFTVFGLAACGQPDNGDPAATEADFLFEQNTGSLTVEFENTSGEFATSEWDFGDGSPVDTTDSPAHTFPASGTFEVRLTVAGPDGDDTRTLEVAVEDVGPVPAPTVTLSVDTEVLPRGGTTTLRISVSDAMSCSAENFEFAGSPNRASSQTITVTDTTTYRLDCMGPDESSFAEVTVALANPPVVTLNATATAIAPGGALTLTWNTGNATQCTASSSEDPLWNGPRATSGGSQVVSPTQSSTYRLECRNSVNVASSAYVLVAVGASLVPALGANFSTIALGGGEHPRLEQRERYELYSE